MPTAQDQLQLTSTDATQIALPIVGIGGRSYAFIIDFHIRVFLVLAWVVLVLSLVSIVELEMPDVKYLLVIPPLIVYGLYHLVLEIVMKGRTPGKRMAGIRIVNMEGHTPSVAAIVIRNVFRLLDSLPAMYVLGLIVAFFTQHHLRIGDIAARTVLVYEQKPESHAFERLSSEGEQVADYRVVEIAEELLTRWHELDRDRRTSMAAKLLESQGGQLPLGLSQQDFDRTLREMLGRLGRQELNNAESSE